MALRDKGTSGPETESGKSQDHSLRDCPAQKPARTQGEEEMKASERSRSMGRGVERETLLHHHTVTVASQSLSQKLERSLEAFCGEELPRKGEERLGRYHSWGGQQTEAGRRQTVPMLLRQVGPGTR